jgi:hypothetical protein
MSIVDKMKKHPALSAVGLGGGALAIDYLVRGDRSLASSFLRSLAGGGTAPSREAPQRAARPTRGVVPGATLLPAMMGYSRRFYYPAYPPSYYWGRWGAHPHEHWFGHGHEHGRGFGHGFHHGRF